MQPDGASSSYSSGVLALWTLKPEAEKEGKKCHPTACPSFPRKNEVTAATHRREAVLGGRAQEGKATRGGRGRRGRSRRRRGGGGRGSQRGGTLLPKKTPYVVGRRDEGVSSEEHYVPTRNCSRAGGGGTRCKAPSPPRRETRNPLLCHSPTFTIMASLDSVFPPTRTPTSRLPRTGLSSPTRSLLFLRGDGSQYGASGRSCEHQF